MSNMTDRLGGARASLAFKAPVRCATTANITLSGFQTIDGITLAEGDDNLRVLVKDQDDASENGIWIAQSGPWTRARDFKGNLDVVRGSRVYVTEGTEGNDTGWVVSAADPIVIGTSDITFGQPSDEAVTDASEAAAAARAAAGFTWTYSSSTSMADPGTGTVRFNNATLSSITSLSIDDLTADEGNPDVSGWISTWDDSSNSFKGTLTFRKANAGQNYVIFGVTALTDNSGWSQVTVTYLSHNGSFTNGDELFCSFVRAGDVGSADLTVLSVLPRSQIAKNDKVLAYDASAGVNKAIYPFIGLPVFDVLNPEFGAVGDDSTDDKAAIQAAADAAYNAGGGIVFCAPTGKAYLVSDSIVLGNGVILMGAAGSRVYPGDAAYTSWALSGSWIRSSNTSNPTVRLAGHGSGLINMNFVRNQVIPTTGTYAPTTFPYEVKVEASLFQIDNIMTVGSTHDIWIAYAALTSGGTYSRMDNLYLGGLVVNVKGENINDIITGRNWQCRTLWYAGNTSLYTYTLANKICIDCGYWDNLLLDGVQFFMYNQAIKCTDQTVLGNTHSMYNWSVTNAQFLLGYKAMSVASGSTTVTGQFSNVNAQTGPGFGSVTGEDMFVLTSDNVDMKFVGMKVPQAGRRVFVIGNGTGGVVDVTDLRVDSYAAAGGAHACCDLAAGAKMRIGGACEITFTSGNGAKFNGSSAIFEFYGGNRKVVVVSGTTYTFLKTDRDALVVFTSASSVAATLPQAVGEFGFGWSCEVAVQGAGQVTITPTTSTINGSSTFVVSTNMGGGIFSDGTNYRVNRGMGSLSASDLNVGTLAIARGGTGAGTATAGFDALSPVTTRGDIIVRGVSNNVRLAVGAANRVLISDGTDPAWGQVPIATAVSGLGTGVATALAVNVGSAGAFVTLNGALGTPSSGTLTNCLGLPSILVANEATDTTCFLLFATAATGELGPKTNANLTYNSSTGAFGIGTSAAFTAGTIELGAASDTTLARSAAGVVTIEGVEIVTLSRTQTLTNKTLTSPTVNGGTLSGMTSFATSSDVDNPCTFNRITVGNWNYIPFASNSVNKVFFGKDPSDNFTIGTWGPGFTQALVVKESDGLVGIWTTSPTAKLDVNSDVLRLRTAKTPASAAASGNAGDICWDSSYIYVCIASSTWRRVLHATW